MNLSNVANSPKPKSFKLDVSPKHGSVRQKRKVDGSRISKDSESESVQSETHQQSSDTKSIASITSESRVVSRALELIGEEYQDSIDKLNKIYSEKRVSNTERALLKQRINNVDKNIEKVTMALEESQILRSLGQYILYQECDNRKIKMVNSRLEAENEWLRKEQKEYEERQKEIAHDLNTCKKEKEARQAQYYLKASGMQDDPITRQRRQSMRVEDVSNLEFPLPPNLHHISTLVETFISSRNYEAGHPLCTYHLNRIKASVGKNHIDYATMLCLSGKLCMMATKMKEAIKCFHEALPIVHRNNHPASVASLYNHISQCYYINGQTEEAERAAFKTLALIEKVHGQNSDEFLMQICILGFLVSQNGKFEDAEKYFILATRNWTAKTKFEDSVKIRLYHAVSNLCAGHISAAEDKVKEIINEIHEVDHGRPSELNPSFWMVIENVRYQKIDKLRQNVREVQQNDYFTAITILKYVYKKRKFHLLESLIDEFLSNPDLEASALDATGESRYFKALTQGQEIKNILTQYIDGIKPQSKIKAESTSSKSSRSGKSAGKKSRGKKSKDRGASKERKKARATGRPRGH